MISKVSQFRAKHEALVQITCQDPYKNLLGKTSVPDVLSEPVPFNALVAFLFYNGPGQRQIHSKTFDFVQSVRL